VAARTSISWADGTWNPFFGCTRVGPGCDNCYAVADVHMKSFNPRLPAYYKAGATRLNADGKPEWTGKIIHNSDRVLSLPERTKAATVWFVNSLSDLFHEALSDDEIVEKFEIMNRCPQHKFQVLTKRANRLFRMSDAGLLRWTPNIWMGVSIENDAMVKRADLLRKVPAHVRFISAEPLLSGLPSLNLEGIDWIIVGGESGPRARPMKADWARDIRDRCIAMQKAGSEIVFHFKQWGMWGEDGVKRTKAANGHLLDGVAWHDRPDKPVEAKHGARTVSEFRTGLRKEREAASYAPIMVGDQRARIALRDIVLNTLSRVTSMEAKCLREHNLILVGLDPGLKQDGNIHAWALSDLVRKRRIRRIKVDTGRVNRRGNRVLEDHYEVIA
jgi:protein gp37